MEHTKEPWVFDQQAEVPLVMTEDGYAIVEACMWGSIRTQAEMSANVRRIITCVNACVGIPTAALEEAATSGVRVSEMLLQQRDELLAILQGLREWNGGLVLRDYIDAAIAKVKP